MSYSSIIQTIPGFWRSPQGIAALGSIGIHGLLLVLLPYISFDFQPDVSGQTVGVVQLTPEEQSRLPQADPNLATIPSTANGQSDLPPLPAPGQPFQSDILPPLPPPTPSFLPPPPPINAPSNQFPIANSLPQSQIPTIPIPLPPPPENSSLSQNPFSQIPPPAPLPNAIPPNQSLPPTSGLKPGELSVPPERQVPPRRQNTTQTQNQVAINPAKTPPQARTGLPERTKQELIARVDALRRQRLASNRSVTDTQRNQRLAAVLQRQQQSSRTATTPNNDSQRLAAVLQRRQQSSRTATNSPMSDTQRLAAALASRQQNTTTPRATSNRLSTATRQTIAQIEAFKQQQEQVKQEFPTAALQAPIRYKIKTCNKQLDGGVAILAAVVNPQGKIISGPDLLSKNSSVAIRRAAKTFVKNYQFPNSAYTLNQPFRLDFSYDFVSCPARSK